MADNCPFLTVHPATFSYEELRVSLLAAPKQCVNNGNVIVEELHV